MLVDTNWLRTGLRTSARTLQTNPRGRIQAEASQLAAAVARWVDEGGACCATQDKRKGTKKEPPRWA
jgi:hypothetical protein